MGLRGLSGQGGTETSLLDCCSKNGDARIAYTGAADNDVDKPPLSTWSASNLAVLLGVGGLLFNSVLVYSHMMCTEYH